jgi:hypothetical protein
MPHNPADPLRLSDVPTLENATLVLGFTGWMDGGDVSTGTVQRLIDLLKARPLAEIDSDPFYITNVPGPMEIAALFRPHIEIEDGLIKTVDLPQNRFFCSQSARVVLFLGKEPNLRWREFGDCVFRVCKALGVRRILFVGSFGGSVPHTRQPRVFVTGSDPGFLTTMERYGLRRSAYAGPGSFTTYLMKQAPSEGLQMGSLVVEIPSYLQGPNPLCIEAATRRLANVLELPLDLDTLRAASTEWELQVSAIVERDKDLTDKVRQLEDEYDNELLESEEQT